MSDKPTPTTREPSDYDDVTEEEWAEYERGNRTPQPEGYQMGGKKLQPTEAPAAKARRMALAVELDEAELACRILEAQVEARRPKGMAAKEALAGQPAGLRGDVMRAARAAILYLHEQINAGSSVS